MKYQFSESLQQKLNAPLIPLYTLTALYTLTDSNLRIRRYGILDCAN
jgi:hypothetical protein